MKLYEIDQQIENLIDTETGEILDFAAFEALQMERDKKIENMALWYKNLLSDAEALEKEEKALADRKKACKNKAENLKAYISNLLQGNKFTTPKVAISFRQSQSVEVDDDFLTWAMMNDETLLKYKNPEPDKTKIKAEIKAGKEFEHARLVTNLNPQIK